MLHIWTGTKSIGELKRLFSPALSGSGIKHQFVPLDAGIPELGPHDTLFALGGKALEILKARGMVPKGRKLSSLRCKRWEINLDGIGFSLFVSYDPTILLVDPTLESDLKWDVQLVARWARTGDLEPEIGEYRWVEGFEDTLLYVQNSPTMTAVALDLETVGLDEFAIEARIVTVSLSYREGFSDVLEVPESGVLPPEVHETLRVLCTLPAVKMVGANLKYDIRWIAQHFGFWITNQTFDTNIVGSILNENRSNSLNTHAKIYTTMGGYDDGFNAKTDKSRMDLAIKADREGFLSYSGGDTDACLRVLGPMRNELLADRSLMNFYVRLLQPAAKAFAMMEHRGVVLDIAKYDELEVEVTTELNRVNAELLALLPGWVKFKYSDNLSITRPAVLQDFLFSKRGLNLPVRMKTEKKEEPSTALEHLEMFEDHPVAGRFVSLMREYGSAAKTLSTYIRGFKAHVRSDGRFHPSYMMFRGDYGGKESGTVTGRTSAKDPAYQTVPKHTVWAKPLRRVYVPPPGMAILKLDYSQGEVRVTACVANESTMIATYKAGLDLHLRTGCRIHGISFDKALEMMANDDPLVKVIRQGGKAGNFGLIYGMQANGFQVYARTTYGVYMDMPEVNAFIDGFFDEYSGLHPWHATAIGFAKAHGFIRSPLGRIRHLPLITSRDQELRSKQERQAINSPIQCTLSDLALLTIALLYERYPDLWVFGFTHDEIQMYVPIDEIAEWTVRVKEVMENLPLKEYFGWEPQLQFIADAEYSLTTLADCEKVKK